MSINFVMNDTERHYFKKIADRMRAICDANDIVYECSDCIMDVAACHLNGNSLKLKELLTAPDFDFIHDVMGIRQHINRKTGQLENCFVPRFSA